MACKYYKQKRQVSYDSGATWIDFVPAEYQKGELYESDSPDCEDYSTKYLTFVPTTEDMWFGWYGEYGHTLDYSLDGGNTWSTISNSNNTTPIVSVGQKIMWKGNLFRGTSSADTSGSYFTNTAYPFNIEGNIMSIVHNDNFVASTTVDNTIAGIFKGTKVVSAEHLILPATSLKGNCYQSLFSGCTHLTTPPELPATTLAGSCYTYMFDGCTSLTTAPALPATDLSNGYWTTGTAFSCYSYMFRRCTSLATPPALPATTLAEHCYEGMFSGCTSLATAPALPAMALREYCYENMFDNCTSLATAPVLSATTLASYCYKSMFNGCTSLTGVTCLATDGIGSGYSTYGWLNNVAATGTFTKASSASWSTGKSGIPSGWTVQNI